MQNYRNILTYEDFQLILTYFKDRDVKGFYKQAETIHKYLKKAYKDAEADGFCDCQRFQIDEYLTFLDDFNWMAIQTTVFKNQSLILIDNDNILKINVLPWMDFIHDNGGLKSTISVFTVMKGVVVNYANGSNTSLTKDIYRFIQDIELLLESILERHTDLN